MEIKENKVILNAITAEMANDFANYMNDDDEIVLTEEDLSNLSELMHDAIMDVVTEYMNSREETNK
jgi:hypothetical protein